MGKKVVCGSSCWRPLGIAAMAPPEWLLLESGHVLMRSQSGPPCSPAVGTTEWLQLERGHLRPGSWRRPPGNSAVGTPERLQLE